MGAASVDGVVMTDWGREREKSGELREVKDAAGMARGPRMELALAREGDEEAYESRERD